MAKQTLWYYYYRMIRTNKGFTLAELITSTAIASVLVMLIALAVNMISGTFMQKREKMAAEETAARAEVLFKLVFSQAVRLRAGVTGGALDSGGAIASGIGEVRDGIVYDQIADTGSAYTGIAVFLREASPALQGVTYGVPTRTAIWYRRPETTSSGVIFFDMGNVAGNLSPTYADQFIDRVSYLSITKRTHPVLTDVLTNLDVVLRIRYHAASNGRFNWCPQLDIANAVVGCTVAANWADVERRFSIVLRNNMLRSASSTDLSSTAVTTEERILGNLYFFQPVLPTR